MLTEVTRRRLRAFRKRRLSYYSLLLLCGLFVLSWFSELIANDRPILSYRGPALDFKESVSALASRWRAKIGLRYAF